MSKRPVTGTDIGKQVVCDHETYVLLRLGTRRSPYGHSAEALAEITPLTFLGLPIRVPANQVFVVEPSEKDCTRCKVYASEYVEGEHGCSYCPTDVDNLRSKLKSAESYSEALEKGIKEQVAEVDRLREIVKLQGPRQHWKGCTAAEAREHYAAGRKVCNPVWPGYVQNNKMFGLSGELGQWLGYLAMGSGPWLFGVEPC